MTKKSDLIGKHVEVMVTEKWKTNFDRTQIYRGVVQSIRDGFIHLVVDEVGRFTNGGFSFSAEVPVWSVWLSIFTVGPLKEVGSEEE